MASTRDPLVRPQRQAAGFYVIWLEAAGVVRRQAVMYLP